MNAAIGETAGPSAARNALAAVKVRAVGKHTHAMDRCGLTQYAFRSAGNISECGTRPRELLEDGLRAYAAGNLDRRLSPSTISILSCMMFGGVLISEHGHFSRRVLDIVSGLEAGYSVSFENRGHVAKRDLNLSTRRPSHLFTLHASKGDASYTVKLHSLSIGLNEPESAEHRGLVLGDLGIFTFGKRVMGSDYAGTLHPEASIREGLESQAPGDITGGLKGRIKEEMATLEELAGWIARSAKCQAKIATVVLVGIARKSGQPNG